MQLSEQAIDKFIAIYEREFNEHISREEASAMARRLINLYRLFLRPLLGGKTVEVEKVEESDSSSSPAS